jgi:hypothetical protein
VIMIEPDHSDIGRKVIYRVHGSAKVKEGVITRFNEKYVFVRFGKEEKSTVATRDELEARKQSRTVPASERCYMYNRLSEAWAAAVRYANDNRESCHISNASLNEFERYHREAVKDRDNVCAGRPLRPYGADVIQH